MRTILRAKAKHLRAGVTTGPGRHRVQACRLEIRRRRVPKLVQRDDRRSIFLYRSRLAHKVVMSRCHHRYRHHVIDMAWFAYAYAWTALTMGAKGDGRMNDIFGVSLVRRPGRNANDALSDPACSEHVAVASLIFFTNARGDYTRSDQVRGCRSYPIANGRRQFLAQRVQV